MDSTGKITIGLLAVLLFVVAGQFVYHNIIVPWPHRDELQACLESARALAHQTDIAEAENTCFRTYPHFN
jgi:hypothetical protein